MNNDEMAKEIAKAVAAHGGRTFFVGGYVRDLLLGKDNKDIDIEVHGVEAEVLKGILSSFGERLDIGKSFGIYNLKGYSIDIAMPRREKQRGMGHRDFEVFTDPFLGVFKAAQRRDFTVNSIMRDVLTGELIDSFNGISDLKNGILRHVNDEAFAEDSLRVLRGAQFAARFGFRVADETVDLCKRMKLDGLSCERVEGELKKALLKSKHPSIFFEVLRKADSLDCWFPELKALIGIKQSPEHHPEGDVWTHTMLVLDEAARYRERVSEPFAFMLSALAHDFGKALCTETVDGKIHSYGHETAGVPLARKFVKRLTDEAKVIKYAVNMTELHMKPNIAAASEASVKSTNKMFDLSVDPEGLICLALADKNGKGIKQADSLVEEFLYERLELYREYMARPYVTGKDLIEAGLIPSNDFSEILEYAHKLRLAGIEKGSALKQVLAYSRKKKSCIK